MDYDDPLAGSVPADNYRFTPVNTHKYMSMWIGKHTDNEVNWMERVVRAERQIQWKTKTNKNYN